MITGTTENSRLQELRKYTVSTVFANQYVGGGSWIQDGVDYSQSPVIEYVTYFIGGIKYVDETLIDGTHTTFSAPSIIFDTSTTTYTGTSIIHVSPPYTSITTTFRTNGGIIQNAGTSIYSGDKKPYYSGTTIYSDIILTTTNPNFVTGATYIKNPNKEKIISNPKIFDDVFIVRDNLSAFEKNYRLEYIRNMIDLTTYAGGKYFNIINNI
jgi:hypothetical protein